MSTPTPSCTWTWARIQVSSQETTPRSESPKDLTYTSLSPFMSVLSQEITSSVFFYLPPSVFCRTCIFSCLSPTAWSIWTCQAQIAMWTRWVYYWQGMVKCIKMHVCLSFSVSEWCSVEINRLHPVSNAAIWGSSEGVLCWSLLFESFQKFLLPQVSHLF